MPLEFTGTVEERLARLDHYGRRCDGKSRRCVHSAVDQYTLRPARNFELIPDAEETTRQVCSKHRRQFVESANWVVIHSRRLPDRDESKPHPYTRF